MARKKGRKVGSKIRVKPYGDAIIEKIHHGPNGEVIGYTVRTNKGATLDVTPDGKHHTGSHGEGNNFAKGGKTPTGLSENDQWESSVAAAIAAELNISNGDAQGLMEANSGEVMTQWAMDANPQDAAKAIIAWDERKREGFRFAKGGKINQRYEVWVRRQGKLPEVVESNLTLAAAQRLAGKLMDEDDTPEFECGYRQVGDTSFAKGGKVDASGMSVRAYLQSLNATALPAPAQSYLLGMIEDEDLDLLNSEDEQVVTLRELIEAEFPGALGATPEPGTPEPAPAGGEAEPTTADYQASLDGAQVMLEFEKKGSKAYNDLVDYIEGLKVMIEMAS